MKVSMRLKISVWPWVAALVLLWVWGLGQAPLFDVDEGAFAEASREMLTSGDWGHTTLNGADRFDKPIFIYWFQAASMALFGVNEWAVRLPSALASVVWCLAVGSFAARWLGSGAGRLGAGMMATCLGVMLIGRASTADAMLNTLITLTCLDLWRHIESGQTTPLRRAYFWMALGALTKGPIALLVPMAATGLYLVTQRDWARIKTTWLDVPGWLIFTVVAVPWYAYALNRFGMTFVEGFILKHNVNRFAKPMEGHGGSVGYYFLMLPLLLWPWGAGLVPAVARIKAAWHEPVSRFLWCWAGFVLVFFSFSGTKLPHYAMYGLTPLVLLIAHELFKRPGKGLALGLAGLQLALIGLLASSEPLAHFLATKTKDVLALGVLSGAHDGPALWLAAVLAVALLAVWGIKRWSVADRAWVSSGLLALWVVQVVIPWWAITMQGPVRDLALVAKARGGPVSQWMVHQPSLAFYLQQPALRADPVPGGMAMSRIDRLQKQTLPVEVIQQSGGWVLVQRKP